MTITRRKTLAGLALLGMMGTAPRAETYPSKALTILVGYGAGGTTDISARILARHLDGALGQHVIVENRPGGSGVIALNEMVKAGADGYTISSFGGDSVFATAYRGQTLDLSRYKVIGGYMSLERVLFAGPAAPFSTVEEMIAYAKNSPVTFADGGAFAAARIIEAFAKKHGLQFRLAPFKSGAEASAALMGGHVMIAETGVGTPAWFKARASGTVKILATLTEGGLAKFGLPHVKSLKDYGSEFSVTTATGLVAPGDIPADRLQRLTETLKKVVEAPAVQEQFAKVDLSLGYIEPQALIERLSEIPAMVKALKAAIAP